MTPVAMRAVLLVAVLVASALGYVWWRSRQGRVRLVEVAGALTPAVLGAARGPRGTVVQFSTPMCSTCPGVRALLQDVVAEYPGVVHVDIDAAERLDLARELHIMRTPTTLVLDARGVVVARMDGAMTRDQARQALATLPPPSDYSI